MTSDIPSSAAGSDDDEAAFAAIAAAAVRQAPTFVGLCDAQLRPCFLNAAGREMVGLSPDADITAYEIVDFFTPQHRALVETVGLPTMLREGRWEGELCFRHFTDPSRQTEVRWSAFALRDDAGDLIGAAAFTTDISARKQAERALARPADAARVGAGQPAAGRRRLRPQRRPHPFQPAHARLCRSGPASLARAGLVAALARLRCRRPADPARSLSRRPRAARRAGHAGDRLPVWRAGCAGALDAGQRRSLPPRGRRGGRGDRRRPGRGRPQARGRTDRGGRGGARQPVPLPRGDAVVHPRFRLRLRSAAALRLCQPGDAGAVRPVRGRDAGQDLRRPRLPERPRRSAERPYRPGPAATG